MHNVDFLNKLFKKLKVKATVIKSRDEGSFLIFDIILNPGGTFRKLESCSMEIALALKSLANPLIYPVTSKGIIKMEVMIAPLDTIFFNNVISSKDFINSNFRLPLALGETRDGTKLIVDLVEMPHLLIGGSTGSGKSILLQTIINSIILSKANFRLALIDPKRVEFSYYNNLSYLYGPISNDVFSSIDLLHKLVEEMDRRFFLFEKVGCRDISCYKKPMPYIIIVIDELADLMMVSKKEVQILICRLAQKSRACGIHLVIATQRPSVNVITGLIKANFPSRISCKVSSIVDSRTILDRSGAEKLAGKGDAIIDCSYFNFKRFKGAYISEEEIKQNIKLRIPWWRKIWNS